MKPSVRSCRGVSDAGTPLPIREKCEHSVKPVAQSIVRNFHAEQDLPAISFSPPLQKEGLLHRSKRSPRPPCTDWEGSVAVSAKAEAVDNHSLAEMQPGGIVDPGSQKCHKAARSVSSCGNDKKHSKKDLQDPLKGKEEVNRKLQDPIAGFSGPGLATGATADTGPELGPPNPIIRSPCRHGENPASPILSSAAVELLQSFPAYQFILPGGGGQRGAPGFRPHRAGFLDCYTGKGGIAAEVARQGQVWVLAFDIEHGAEQNLLCPTVQTMILKLVLAGAFCGIGWPQSVGLFRGRCRPAIRSPLYPSGLPALPRYISERVKAGNSHSMFCFRVVRAARRMDIAYWCENPDGSYLWQQPEWRESGLCGFECSYRCDQCQYGTPWRKRSRFITNTALAGNRCFCDGLGHTHVQLTGYCHAAKKSWTRVAQTYPRALCFHIAHNMVAKAGLGRTPKALPARYRRLNFACCAKAGTCRIGEASNPGP